MCLPYLKFLDPLPETHLFFIWPYLCVYAAYNACFKSYSCDICQTEWQLTPVYPQERSSWRSGVRSAMRAARQLPVIGPTDVDDAPAC